jgi:hypothetical protein
MASNDGRKRQILDHVNRTSGTVIRNTSQSAEEKKRRILDHVNRSQG